MKRKCFKKIGLFISLLGLGVSKNILAQNLNIGRSLKIPGNDRKITLSEKDLMVLIKSMTKDALIKNIELGNDLYSIDDTIRLINEEDLHKKIKIIPVLERDLKLGTQDSFTDH